MPLSRKDIAIMTLLSVLLLAGVCFAGDKIQLPKPEKSGAISVQEAMIKISTQRNFIGAKLELSQVAQLLWAANGNLEADAITGATRKLIPSAGGLYPLEVFLVAGKDKVGDLLPGVYRYIPGEHALKIVSKGDKRAGLAMAAFGQTWLANAPCIILITGVFPKTLVKYGKRGVYYVYMEGGASNQNLYLQAASLGLKTAAVGAFNNKLLHKRAGLPKKVKPILIVAIGKDKTQAKAKPKQTGTGAGEENDSEENTKEPDSKNRKSDKKTDKPD
jgi:SagB-type dehydrogenase family enzyme